MSDLTLPNLLCARVYALHHAFGRYYASAFAPSGFTYTKNLILMALAEDGPMSLGTLGSRLGVEANSLSPIVKKMASFDLIERVRDPRDERRIALAILPYGREVLAAAQAVTAEGWDSLELDGEEVAKAIALLETVRRRLEETELPPLELPPPSRDEPS